MSTTVYLGLGSNLGDRSGHIEAALEALLRHGKMTARSSLFESEPMYHAAQPRFLNMAAAFSTELEPRPLLAALKSIEWEMGRDPDAPRNGPRVIDLDILFYGDRILFTPELTIPHPRLAERAFVLAPLIEIAPQFVHPVSRLTIAELHAQVALGDLRRIGPLR